MIRLEIVNLVIEMSPCTCPHKVGLASTSQLAHGQLSAEKNVGQLHVSLPNGHAWARVHVHSHTHVHASHQRAVHFRNNCS